MRVAISAAGDSLEAGVETVFGRCAMFLCVDTETLETTAWPNPALGASGGAAFKRRSSCWGRGPRP
jgi:predicted Fe-Mo cluster-binding NifX family protein